MDYDKHQLLEKLQKEIIPQEFGNNKISPPEIEKYFEKTLQAGFKHIEAITDLVKAQIYLNNQEKLIQLIKQAENEFGTNLERILMSLLPILFMHKPKLKNKDNKTWLHQIKRQYFIRMLF
ncbi:hypothetical protein [Aggregatibacter actinomycetemcomitans]|nr:hypothetical protein [Aggregatibacter actinomycetemcomitans]